MQLFARTFAVVCLAPVAVTALNPVTKAVELLDGIAVKIKEEGAALVAHHKETEGMCRDEHKDNEFGIQTAQSKIDDEQATIDKASSEEQTSSTRIDETAANIADNDNKLKAASGVRAKEEADYAAATKELEEVIDTLGRAIGILERELKKNGAAFLQGQNFGSLTSAFTALVEASVLSSADASKLTALVQSSSQRADDADGEDLLGAPAAAVYEGHSGDIISQLEDLQMRARKELSDALSEETAKKQNFAMVQQSLTQETAYNKKEMDEAKSDNAEAKETKATAQGKHDRAVQELQDFQAALASNEKYCTDQAERFEAETASIQKELAAIAAARGALVDMTGGAQDAVYGFAQVSLLQRSSSDDNLAGFEALRLLKDLARTQGSTALAQVASRVGAVMRSGSNTRDVFAKVKDLINGLISNLEAEAKKDATKETWCQEENAKSTADKDDKESTVSKLATKLDQTRAASDQLKEEIVTVQKELSNLAKDQAAMNKQFQVFTADAAKTKTDLDGGLTGVRTARQILKEFYGGGAGRAGESAGNIFSMLEVVEADFSQSLAQLNTAVADAESDYKKSTQENTITTAAKKKDLTYKTREVASLDKSANELQSDYDGAADELNAVNEYLEGLKKRCTAKAESYGEKKAKRDAEIAGLKEALSILENQAALVQSKKSLRGVRAHQ